MEIRTLVTVLKKPNRLQLSDLEQLNAIIETYPYFQAVKALKLKTLKNQGSHLYNQKLKETAAYTTNREVLFDFITSKVFLKTSIEKNTIEEDKDSLALEIKIDNDANQSYTMTSLEANQITDPLLFQKKEATVPAININEPLKFTKTETHSFTEWLHLTSLKPIKRKPTPTTSTNKKFIESKLIDEFIENSPKISPVSKTAQKVNLVKQNDAPSNNLMTETLAKVYLAQKNYKKAIQAYKILILKNPEKSGLFADQIRAIEKLKDNK